MEFPLPLKFKMSQLEMYDGSRDPMEHLATYKTLMNQQAVPNEIYVQGLPYHTEGTCSKMVQQLASRDNKLVLFHLSFPSSLFKEASSRPSGGSRRLTKRGS
jgi:hypothetical protein